MFDLPKALNELIDFNSTSLAVASRESKHREYKEDFAAADLSDYTKALAAFANAGGGYLLFGVSNRPRQIVGVTNEVDEAQWVDRLRQDFDPELPISIVGYKVGSLNLFAVGVDQLPIRPVVCRKSRSKLVKSKDTEVIREGTIYYRYAGQSRPIGYSELTTLLHEREERRVKAFMDTINVIQKIGVESTGILKMTAQASSIFMTPETAKGLSLIDKGRLVQERGSPAYVVVGNVDVANVVHAPLAEADKNLPSEAARVLSGTVKEVYGGLTGISAQQVTSLLRHLEIDGDNIHSVHERKLRRKYITRAGIKAVEDFVRASPEEALNTFGSQAAKTAYGVKNVRDVGDIEA